MAGDFCEQLGEIKVWLSARVAAGGAQVGQLSKAQPLREDGQFIRWQAIFAET
jgi:hypothetical protein